MTEREKLLGELDEVLARISVSFADLGVLNRARAQLQADGNATATRQKSVASDRMATMAVAASLKSAVKRVSQGGRFSEEDLVNITAAADMLETSAADSPALARPIEETCGRFPAGSYSLDDIMSGRAGEDVATRMPAGVFEEVYSSTKPSAQPAALATAPVAGDPTTADDGPGSVAPHAVTCPGCNICKPWRRSDD